MYRHSIVTFKRGFVVVDVRCVKGIRFFRYVHVYCTVTYRLYEGYIPVESRVCTEAPSNDGQTLVTEMRHYRTGTYGTGTSRYVRYCTVPYSESQKNIFNLSTALFF